LKAWGGRLIKILFIEVSTLFTADPET